MLKEKNIRGEEEEEEKEEKKKKKKKEKKEKKKEEKKKKEKKKTILYRPDCPDMFTVPVCHYSTFCPQNIFMCFVWTSE